MLHKRLAPPTIFPNPAYVFQNLGSRKHSQGITYLSFLIQRPDAYRISSQLNVDVCQHLAELGAKLKFTLIYISTGRSSCDRKLATEQVFPV